MSRLASAQLPADKLAKPQQLIWDKSRKTGVLLVPAGHLQPLHGTAVVLRRQVALGAVLVDDVEQAGDHGDARDCRPRGPVHVNPVGGIEIGAGACVCTCQRFRRRQGRFQD